MNETVGAALAGVGVLFEILGCIGLVRLPDVYNRLQAATKCVTAGTCLIVLGAAVSVGSAPALVKGAICIALILITSPTAAHALARAAHRAGVTPWQGTVVDRLAEARRGVRGEEGTP